MYIVKFFVQQLFFGEFTVKQIVDYPLTRIQFLMKWILMGNSNENWEIHCRLTVTMLKMAKKTTMNMKQHYASWNNLGADVSNVSCMREEKRDTDFNASNEYYGDRIHHKQLNAIFQQTNQSSFILSLSAVKAFQFKFKELRSGLMSMFSDRTDEASAVQYFQVNTELYLSLPTCRHSR